MDIFKNYRYFMVLFLLSALPAFASEEAPSTPSRKRSRSKLILTPSPKKRRNRQVEADQDRLSPDYFSLNCRGKNEFKAWWDSLNDQDKEKVVTLQDGQGKTLAHYLAVNDESSAAKIAMRFPHCLLTGNNLKAIPADYVRYVKGPNGSIVTGLDGHILLSETHKMCKNTLDSTGRFPSALNALIASMVVCDMGAGFRA